MRVINFIKRTTVNISIKSLGKRYNTEWIFRDLNLDFTWSKSYAITGANGSGKSTLLQVISGIQPTSEGTIQYQINDHQIDPEIIYKYLSICTPYQELIEEFTLTEMVDFHIGFKSLSNNLTTETLIEKLQLKSSANKEIRHFSSGMKQRVKLGLAVYSQTPILLLDEPTTNLDDKGIEWYKQLILEETKNRLLIICSNQLYEYNFCDEIIRLNS